MIKKLWSRVKSILEALGKLISSIVNFMLLFSVYFVGIGIVSISMKLFGKNFLELKKKNAKSNWHEHKVAQQPLESYYRTF